MGTKPNAFVQPSAASTLRFVPQPFTAADIGWRRIAAGLLTSAAVVTGAVAWSHPTAASAGVPSPPPPPAAHAAAVLTAAPDVYSRAAATCPGLPASVLSAIHEVETRRATQDAPTSSKGARGPMQFLLSTWQAYATDGDGDGRADIDNAADAVFTAARHLCTNGAGDASSLRSAVWNYNHSWAYVDEVMRHARTPASPPARS